MNKKICPDCGFENKDGENTVCPECGCPLSESDVEIAAPAPNASENSTAADKELQGAIEKNGCINTWHSRCKKESRAARVTDTIGSVLEACAGIAALTFLILLIVNGIKYDTDYQFTFFYNFGRVFISGIASAFALSKILETISCHIELRKCTSWLNDNHLNTLYCSEIENYGMRNKNSIFYDDHKIEVAYCGAHPEYVKKCGQRRIAKCVVYVVSAVLLAGFGYIVIEQMLKEIVFDSANFYLLLGFGIGIFLIEFINWLIRRILDKDFYEKNDNWLRESKTKKSH